MVEQQKHWVRNGNAIRFVIDTCNVAQATHMRSYGETEVGMDRLTYRRFTINLPNFKGWRQIVHVCSVVW